MAGGKTSVSAVLQERYGFLPISSGAFLRSQLALQNRSNERRHLQDLGDTLDQASDFLWLIDLVARPVFEERPHSDNWLVDAVREPRQVEFFRSGFTDAVRHVHVVAPEDVLWQRYACRSALPLARYQADLLHPNEQSARSLAALVDQILGTDKHTSFEIADLIMGTWER
jgi:adenylosuccinate synthase